MSRKKWVVADIDKPLCKDISADCDIDPFVALLLTARGMVDPIDIEEFLSDEPDFLEPSSFLGIHEAVDRINKAIDDFERIAIYGDYDVDGITSTALVYSFLVSKGADVMYYIPDRSGEGYGMNLPSIDKLSALEVSLIITVDNGINANKEIAYAKSLGIDVVVTDHHLPSGEPPDAVAIVNPHQEGCTSTFKAYAGVGVAFMLICAIEGAHAEELLHQYGDLVALGTIADIMPLTGENRKLVKAGITLINQSPRIGVAALIKVAGLENKKINAGSIGFMLAPRLNAAGRIGSPDRAVNLLLTEDIEVANNLAEELNSENICRQQMEADILKEVTESLERDFKKLSSRVLVVSGKGWHHGVLGLIAAKLCEKYGKPAIVLSIHGDEAVGSARSISGVSIYELIEGVAHKVIRFGGHKAAAGLLIKSSEINEFTMAINDFAKTKFEEMPFPLLKLDCKLNLASLSTDTVYAQRELEPFGAGNATPLYGLFGVKLEEIMPVSDNKHLKLKLSKNGAFISAIKFSVNASNFCYRLGDMIDVAIVLDINNYKGSELLSIVIKDIRYSEVIEEKLLTGIRKYEKYVLLEEIDESLAPTRDEIAMVYKSINGKNKQITTYEALYYQLLNKISYEKIRICMDILNELELIMIKASGEFIEITPELTGIKVDLNSSKILSRLK